MSGTLVEDVPYAVKSDPLLKKRFGKLQKRMHRNRAIVGGSKEISSRIMVHLCSKTGLLKS